MPNQDNFRNDITTPTDSTFFASRIVKNLEEGVLLEEIPASFGFSKDDVIEIHFYTLSTNILTLSTTVSVLDENVLKTHIVQYTDGTYKTYLRVDFTKLFSLKNLILIPGEYKVVFNLFSNEIGSYENRELYIQEISPSKQEIQIGFVSSPTPSTKIKNRESVNNFVYKHLTKAIAIGVAEKVFISGVELNDISEGVNYINIVENIEFTDPTLGFVTDLVQSRENTIGRIQRLGIEQDVKVTINNFIKSLFPIIREKIVVGKDEKITQSEFQILINEVLRTELPRLQTSLMSKIIVE